MEKIEWREWNEESFNEAAETDKPVLLAVSAVWCHWCHVMDSVTYSDDRVIELANERFVPIRVDTDRRPDINTRYNMGGWPSTVFLTPDADILTGATYLPPEQMVDLMGRVADLYASAKDELVARAEQMRKELRESRAAEAGSTSMLTENIVSRVVRSIIGSYDNRHGGFGVHQKFPHTDALDLLIMEYHRAGDKDLLEMVTKTLDAMSEGEIHDKINGGFFRYSTENDWSVPHYEKMLTDNAALMSTYVSVYQETGEDRYLQVALDISRYLNDWLYDAERGVFYGSQDADEEYYQPSAEWRARRQAPRVDQTVYTNWNATAAYSYLRLYQATLNQEHRDRAIRCIDFLVKNLRMGNRLFGHFYDTEPRQFGILHDQITVLWALISAFESTAQTRYLSEARELANGICGQHRSENDGLLDVTAERMKEERLVLRDKPLDENALGARAFDRLSFVAQDLKWKRNAEAMLLSLTPVYESYGMMAAPYALAVLEVLDEPVRISIAGDKDSTRTLELLQSALKTREPRKIVHVLDPHTFKRELEDLGYQFSEEPRAYICHGTACLAAVSEPDEIAEAVTAVGAHAVDVEEM